jgi:hypothetical protein
MSTFLISIIVFDKTLSLMKNISINFSLILLFVFFILSGCIQTHQDPIIQTSQSITITPISSPVSENLNIDKSNPKSVSLRYTLNGKTDYIQMNLYDGIYQYVKQNAPADPVYSQDWFMKRQNMEIKNKEIDNLVDLIKQKSIGRDDDARIAISLVQNIPYDLPTPASRTFYEVLYDQKGACGEKSELLAYLLNKLGYDAVLLEFPTDNHMAVGIKSPQEYSYQKSGYAFVETTEISIPTYSDGDYVGVGKLHPTFSIVKISIQTRSMSTIFSEALDATDLDRIQNGGQRTNDDYNLMMNIFTKYGIPLEEPKIVKEGQLTYYYT